MVDLSALQATCSTLAARLEGQAREDDLRGVYLDLAPLIGQLQASVAERGRSGGENREMDGARQALDALKGSARQVGHDIRLASPAALQLGLRVSLEYADEVLEQLRRAER